MKRIISLLVPFLLVLSMPVFCQSGISDEEFNVTLAKTANGAQWIFKGKAHSFSVDIIAKKIVPTESANYLTADNRVLQASVIPMPKSNWNLSKLSPAQQKEALSRYVDYELDYFKNDLHINYKDLNKEWIMVGPKLWLVWTFNSSDFISPEPVKDKPKFQIYASTICYNQVLDLNTPVMSDQSLDESKKIISRLMASLRF
ncbi:MAG: hypothetical protein JO301_11480 [Chitinophagaceae bacterium]|nr:hypothetical protein [Chitinophagaceae bacterium]